MEPNQGTGTDQQHQGLTEQDRLATVPLRAQKLFEILVWHVGRNPDCWPHQETLSVELGVCVRQVRGLLEMLVAAGLIGKRRTNRGNRYEILTRDRQKTSGRTGRKLPVRPAENCRFGPEENCRSDRKRHYGEINYQ